MPFVGSLNPRLKSIALLKCKLSSDEGGGGGYHFLWFDKYLFSFNLPV